MTSIFRHIRLSTDIDSLQEILTSGKDSIATESLLLQRNTEGLLPIYVAVQVEKWDFVALLASLCPETCLATPSYCQPVLHAMLVRNAPSDYIFQVIEACPKACTFASRPESGGLYALHVALKAKAEPIVLQALLEKAPEVLKFAESTQGRTPLHFAVAYHTPIPFLRKMLADTPKDILSYSDCDGQVPLHVAIESGCGEAVVSLLTVANPECLRLVDSMGFLPIQLACAANAWHHVLYLAKTCPSTISTKDPLGDLALHIALASRAWNAASTLVSLAPETAAVPDRCDRLPLHVALQELCSSASPSLIKVLMEAYPAAISIPDGFQSLPIHYALRATQWALALSILSTSTSQYDHDDDFTWTLVAQYGAPRSVIQELAKHSGDTAPSSEVVNTALKFRYWNTVIAILESFPSAASVKNSDRLLPIQVASVEAAPDNVLCKCIEAYSIAASQMDKSGNTMAYATLVARKWTLVEEMVKLQPTVAAMCNSKGELLIQSALKLCAPTTTVIEIAIANPLASNGDSWFFVTMLESYKSSFTEKELTKIASSPNVRSIQGPKDGDEASSSSILHVAIKLQLVAFISVLLHQGYDVFYKNSSIGKSALDLAAESKSVAVRNLVNLSALVLDKKWLNENVIPPLAQAIAASNLNAVKALLAAGANTADSYISSTDDDPLVTQTVAKARAKQRLKESLINNRYVKSSLDDNSNNNDSSYLALDITNGQYVYLHYYNEEKIWRTAYTRWNRLSNNLLTKCLDYFQEGDEESFVIVEEGGPSVVATMGSSSSKKWKKTEAYQCSIVLCQALCVLHTEFRMVHSALSTKVLYRTANGTYKLGGLNHCIIINDDGAASKAMDDNVRLAGLIMLELFTSEEGKRNFDSVEITNSFIEKHFLDDDDDTMIKVLIKQMVLKDDRGKRPDIVSVLSTLKKNNVTDLYCPSLFVSSNNQQHHHHLLPPIASVAEIVHMSLEGQKKQMHDMVKTQQEDYRAFRRDKKVLESQLKEWKSKAEVSYEGASVRKLFDDGEYYNGTVVGPGRLEDSNNQDCEKQRRRLWTVQYEDGDSEELYENELQEIIEKVQSPAKRGKLRGRFAKSKITLEAGAIIYLARRQKIVAMATVSKEDDDQQQRRDDMIDVVVTKVFTKKNDGNDTEKNELVIAMGQKTAIKWKVSQCFVPSN